MFPKKLQFENCWDHISFQNNLNNEKLIWRVVENEKDKSNFSDISLDKFDIIKFGKYKVFISDISKKDQCNDTHSLIFSDINKKIIIEDIKSQFNEELLCRFCHCRINEYMNDYLISLCNCIGSIKFVHFKCLEKWVHTKLYYFEERSNY